jgi:hypothetical protein
MKITRTHYDTLCIAMSHTISTNPRMLDEYRSQGLSEKRYRWDLLRMTTVAGIDGIRWICDNLYDYMNDDHIDTALRRITNTN